VAICLTALFRFPFCLLCYSLAFVFPSWSSLLGFSVFVGSFVFVVVGFSSCLQLLLSKFPHSHNTHLQKKKTNLQNRRPICRRRHPPAEDPSFFFRLLFSRGAWECGRGIWSSNCDFSSALRNSLEQIWALGRGRQTRRLTDRLGVLTLSQYLFFLFSRFLHATTILFSLESHHHIPFVNCLVVVLLCISTSFSTQAS
jgi:hypothetical protein